MEISGGLDAQARPPPNYGTKGKGDEMRLRVQLGLAVAALFLAALAASAVTPLRETVSLSGGKGTWTHGRDYVVGRLVRVDVTGAGAATCTGTITHVIGSVTQTLGSVTCSAGAGTYLETNKVYVFKGDKVSLAGFGTNTATALLVLELFP